MGWTRRTDRVARVRRRPGLETLESRQLLSVLGPIPAASSGLDLNADGTVDADKVIEASAARVKYGLDGSGLSVAVIDTGVDYKNPSLGGSIGVGHKVVAGVDFTGSPNGVLPTWQHGTGVAGLIGSDDPSDLGVAPGVGIVALRVFGDNNAGSFANIAQALEWVAQHHSDYDITAVNLSVTDGGNYQTNTFAQDGGIGQRITGDVEALDALNIPVVVATGNSFDGKAQGEGFASIIPDTIGVTATDESKVTASHPSDPLSSTAQRLGAALGGASATDIAAPGVGIKAPSGDSGTETEDGTSFATPQVTGAIVLLQQMYEDAYHTLPSVAQVRQWLQQGAAPVHDPATGITIGRLDVLGSLGVLDALIHPAATVVISTSAVASAPTETVPTAPATVAKPSTPIQSDAPSDQTRAVASNGDSGSKPIADNPPAAAPMTEVIVNGLSIGSYSTAQLAKEFGALFALSKGPIKDLRVWASSGSSVNLGRSTPSGSASKPYTTDPRVKLAQAKATAVSAHAKVAVVKAKAVAPPKPQAPAVPKPKAKKAAKHFNPFNPFGLPFPF